MVRGSGVPRAGHCQRGASNGWDFVTHCPDGPGCVSPPHPLCSPLPSARCLQAQRWLGPCWTPCGLRDTACTRSPRFGCHHCINRGLSTSRATVPAGLGRKPRGYLVPRLCHATSPGFLETAQSRATTKLLSWLLRSDMKPQVPAGCSAEAWAGSPACAGGELRQRGERCGGSTKHSTHPQGHFPGAAEPLCAHQHQGCPRRGSGVPQPQGHVQLSPRPAATPGRGSSTQKGP